MKWHSTTIACMKNPNNIRIAGWWSQTFFIFHNIWDSLSNWRICFRGVAQPPTRLTRLCWSDLIHSQLFLVKFRCVHHLKIEKTSLRTELSFGARMRSIGPTSAASLRHWSISSWWRGTCVARKPWRSMEIHGDPWRSMVTWPETAPVASRVKTFSAGAFCHMLPRLAAAFSKGCIHSLNMGRSFEPSTSLALYLVVVETHMFVAMKPHLGWWLTVRKYILDFFRGCIYWKTITYQHFLCGPFFIERPALKNAKDQQTKKEQIQLKARHTKIAKGC